MPDATNHALRPKYNSAYPIGCRGVELTHGHEKMNGRFVMLPNVHNGIIVQMIVCATSAISSLSEK